MVYLDNPSNLTSNMHSMVQRHRKKGKEGRREGVKWCKERRYREKHMSKANFDGSNKEFGLVMLNNLEEKKLDGIWKHLFYFLSPSLGGDLGQDL